MNYKNKSLYIELSIFVVILLSRLIVSNFGDWFHSLDSVNYLLAIDDFNIIEQRPHLPGYILYIYFLKLVTFVFAKSNATLIIFQAIFQGVSGVLIYKVIRKRFEQNYSLLLIAFLYSIPMVYFYGIMSEIYSLDIFLISLFIFLIDRNKIYYLLPTIAIILGARQSSGILLIPAFLGVLYYNYKSINIKYLVLSIFTSLIIIVLWIIPLFESADGLKNYKDMMDFHSGILSTFTFRYRIFNFLSYSLFFLIPFVLIFIKAKINIEKAKKSDIIILFLLVLPQFITYMFYHYNKGYALFMIPAIFLLMLYKFRFNKKIISILIVINLTFFYFFPAKTPTYNIQMTGETRGIDLVDLWIQKLNYNWLPTLSSNQITIDLHQDIVKNKAKILNVVKGNSILIDNSNIISARNIAYLIPETEIITRSFRDYYTYESFNHYFEYSNNEDIVPKIKSGYVLVEKEYFKQYLSDIFIIKFELDYYYLIKVNEEFIDEYLKINKIHFVG